MLSSQRFFANKLVNFGAAWFASTRPASGVEAGAGQGKDKKVIDQKTLDYLQKRIKERKGRGILDKENYRVDIGLLMNREPIFLQFEEKEMEGLKFRLKYGKKYKLLHPVPKEMTEFSEKEPSEGVSEGIDDLPTHELVHPDGTRVTYSANSKIYTKVDPDITDPKSIQYASVYRVYLMVKEKATQKWAFPSTHMVEKATFGNSKTTLFDKVSLNKWQAVFPLNTPACVVKRDLTEEEKKDPLNKRAVGVKTFYFIGYHHTGTVSINEELYDDYAWVTRLELNQYLDRDSYNNFVHALSLY